MKQSKTHEKTLEFSHFPKENESAIYNEVFSLEFCNESMYRKFAHAFQGKPIPMWYT